VKASASTDTNTVKSTYISRIWVPKAGTQNQPYAQMTTHPFSFATAAWKSMGLLDVWRWYEKERNVFLKQAKMRY